MATTESEVLAEDGILREGCGLVDRSERGKLALEGEGAVDFLNGQVTNELADLAPGEGRYAAFLDHKGKMLGDLRILAVGEGARVEELLLDTERVALQALFDMIRRFKIGYRVELRKRTVEEGLYSLMGPRAGTVAAAAAGLGVDDLPAAEDCHAAGEIAGVPVRMVAGFQGSIDVFFPAEHADGVRAALLAAGARPVGERAAEVLRVEGSRPRFGVDMDESTIPQEAGLNERAVSFTKGCYLGQETVARLFYRGKPNRHLRGLRLSAPAPTGSELRLGERTVGRLGSSVLSPRLGPIALALVRREAEPGALLAVGDGDVRGEVVELPFLAEGP